MEPATLKLVLHYYFEDRERHSMDAFVRNDNERDILAILRQSNDLLRSDIKIEIVAADEGGLIDKYILTGKTLAVVTVVISGAALYLHWEMNQSQIKLNDSQIELNKSQARVNASQERLNTLQIEEIELERANRRRALRKKLQKLESDTALTKVQSQNLSREISDEIADTLSQDYKAIWHRSKFFDRSLKATSKIEKISTQILDESDRPVQKEVPIDRRNFKLFVLANNSVQSLIDKDAVIEIISPVLNNKAKYTWRGLYNGEVITFSMLDKLFIQKIQNREVEFKNGTTIRCVLEQKRKIDDATGLIRIIKNNVLSVAPIDDADRILTIPKRRKLSAQGGSQLQLGLTTKGARRKQ